jgi:hypothetical protein
LGLLLEVEVEDVFVVRAHSAVCAPL